MSITLSYCHAGRALSNHSISINPLMSWAFQWTWKFHTTFDISRALEPTAINISLDWPLACRSQLYQEGVGTRISSFQQILRRSNGRKVEFIKMEQLVKILFILNLDDGMDVALES